VLAGGRAVSMTASRAARTAGRVRDIEREERQLHHIAEAGPGRGQAPAQVLEYLPRLRRRIARPDQFTALVQRDLAAHHHQPTPAGEHLTVAAPQQLPPRELPRAAAPLSASLP
jgi:hypothetical protein